MNRRHETSGINIATEYYQDIKKRNSVTKGVPPDVKAKIQAEFMRRFEMLRGERSCGKFSEDMGLNNSAVYNYLRGIRFPDAMSLAMIAIHNGVTVDWLLGLDGDEVVESQEA